MNEEMNELLPMEDKPKATKKSPKKKNTYGQYGNVQLTDEELVSDMQSLAEAAKLFRNRDRRFWSYEYPWTDLAV